MIVARHQVVRTDGQHYRASLIIAERLAYSDPDNVQCQRDITISRGALRQLERALVGTSGQNRDQLIGARSPAYQT
jgi:hypothetical protein